MPNTHTDTLTMLHATLVAIGHILCTEQYNNNNNNNNNNFNNNNIRSSSSSNSSSSSKVIVIHIAAEVWCCYDFVVVNS